MNKKWKIGLWIMGAVGLTSIIAPLAVSCGEDKNNNPSIEIGESLYDPSEVAKKYIDKDMFEKIKTNYVNNINFELKASKIIGEKLVNLFQTE